MNCYYKNFILCGEIDYYCLLCQESFEGLESVDKHLKWEKHRKSLKNQEYDEAFRKEYIYKVRDIYYCEICNKMTNNPLKHKGLDSHKHIKNNPQDIEKKSLTITRNVDDTFSIENFKMDSVHWHGIKNDYCTLCKRSVRNVAMHIQSNVHRIHLIVCETKVFQDYYYRQICDDKFYCFLCCGVFSNTSLKTHWSQECEFTFKAKVILNETDRNLIKNDPELANALYSIQKLFFNIDKINNKAECLECKETVKATLEAMLKHRNKHTSNDMDSGSSNESYEVKFSEVVDHGKRRHELAVYGKDNFIKLNRGGSWGYCSLCDVSISAHMKQAMNHVQGIRHNGFLELIGVKKPKQHEEPTFMKQKITFFLSHVYRIEYKRMYYVKDHLPVTDLCFMLMKEVGKKAKTVKCFACDVIVDKNDAPDHYKTKSHKDRILACYVIIVDEGMEFIRMIRTNLYHCGICNVALPFWESVKSHVVTLPHTFNKRQKILHCGEARELRRKFGIRNRNENFTVQLKRLGLL